MKHSMRRQDRQLSAEATIAILEKGEYGIVSSVGSDGQPYGLPVSYVLREGCVEFHSATEGHKITNFNENNRVSFCVVGKTQVLPKKFSTKYESAIVFGIVSELVGEEKQKSLEALIRKYSPEHSQEGDTYIQASQNETKVFSIVIERLTGKARK